MKILLQRYDNLPRAAWVKYTGIHSGRAWRLHDPRLEHLALPENWQGDFISIHGQYDDPGIVNSPLVMLYFIKYPFYFNLLPPDAYINFGDLTVKPYKLFSRQTAAEHLVGPHVAK